MTSEMTDIGLGHISGRLQVVDLLPDHTNPSGKRYQRVQVHCSCGHSFAIHANRIRDGKATRCPRCVRASQQKYHVGDRYGDLVIQAFTLDPRNRRMAQCLCSCGRSTDVFVGLFKRNKTFNCGCKPLSHYTGVGDLSGAFFYRLCRNATARGLTVDVTKEDLWALFQAQNCRCALTGLPIILTTRGLGTASVDRKDSNLGYTLENSQWVHKDINLMKMDLPQNHFVWLCQMVAMQHKHNPPLMPEAVPSQGRKRPGKKTSRE